MRRVAPLLVEQVQNSRLRSENRPTCLSFSTFHKFGAWVTLERTLAPSLLLSLADSFKVTNDTNTSTFGTKEGIFIFNTLTLTAILVICDFERPSVTRVLQIFRTNKIKRMSNEKF